MEVHPRKNLDHGYYFNRRSKIYNSLSNKIKPVIIDPNDDGILPSIINYKCNVEFPYSDDCSKNDKYKITHVGKNGIIITKPGTYKFASNIFFKTRTEHTCAIIIRASHVTLDLGQYSLIQKNKRIPNVYGIVVTRDVKYVTITGKKNIATIKNFTLAGIRIYGKTQYIDINNIIVKQTIPVQLTNDQIPESCADILQLSLTLGIAIGEGDGFGVHMQGTNKANLVEELSITDVTVDGATIGCHMIFTFGFEILRSVFTKNTYYGLLNGTGWIVPGDGPFGLQFPVGGDGVITDCRFERNRGLNFDLANPADLFVFDFVSAVANYEVSNVKIDRCLIADNSNNGYIIAADHDAARNIKWSNCVITETRSIFEPADGLHFSGSIPRAVGNAVCTGADYPLIQDFNITVDNCTATDGKSDGGRAVGILFAYVQGGHVSNCNSSGMVGGAVDDGNRSPNSLSTGFYVVGGLPGGRTSNITFVNNTSERNGASGFGRSAGFIIDNVVDNIVMKDNIANGNGNSQDLDHGAGFLVQSRPIIADDPDNPINFDAFIKNIDFDNCVAKGNGNGLGNSGGFVIYNTIPNQLPPIENVAIEKSVSKFNNGYGFLINGNVEGASINETELYQNTLGGINIINNPNKVFVSRNTAYLNGGFNYQGISPSIIVTGTTNNFPANPGMNNVSIN
jgi:hypothetical protein